MQKQDLTNRELAEYLKEEYKINFNISQELSPSEKEEIIKLIEENDCVKKLINTFVIKNQDLGNNNRQFGRQREQAKRDLVETAEKNEELNNELSLVRFELKEMRKMLTNVLEITLEKLMKNMFTRSEIIIIFKELISAVNIKEKVK